MADSLEKIYSQAMFELCDEKNCIDDVYEELTQAKAIFSENEEFVKLLASPLVDVDEKKAIIEKVFGGRVSDVVLDFFGVITEKGRAHYISAICDEYKKLYYKKNNILDVKVVTTEPLSDRLRDKLLKKLEDTFKKQIIMQESVDKSIIGGIIVKFDNSEIDSSIRGRLDKLRSSIDSVIA